MAKLEDLDRKIVDLLMDDSRMSYRQLAKRLGVSVATVASHVGRLEEDKVILGYTTKLDYEKLGFSFPVMIEVKVAHGKLFETEKKIAQDRHVFMVIDHTGGMDTTVVARFRDREELDRFVKRIQLLPFVERTETQLILNIIKDEPVRL